MRRLITILCVLPSLSLAQKLENIKAEASGERILVSYDLVQGDASDSYTISLFASHNNFRSPLARVRGDVGAGIKTGRGKRIEWEAKAEMGSFKGELTFEVEAVVVAPLTLKSTFGTIKRGSTQSVSWRGGTAGEKVRIELLKNGQVDSEVASVNNGGTFAWQVSGKQKPGDDYSLRLVIGREIATSASFAIKPKIATWMKIAVPVAIAGVLLLPKSSEGPTSDNLPAPPTILD